MKMKEVYFRVEENSERSRETVMLACCPRALSLFPGVCILLCRDFRRVKQAYFLE